MKGLRSIVLLLAASMAFTVTPAVAERLVTSLSNHRVMVTSSYTGVDLVLFGSVELDDLSPTRREGYDVVVTVSSPRDDERTSRKSRVLGIWINTDSRTFIKVPSYLAILSSRPVEMIAPTDTLHSLHMGFDNIQLPQRFGPDGSVKVTDDAFRRAFARLKKENGLFVDQENAVTFLTTTLFRADVPMPANVPFGIYEIDVKLFADGALIAQTGSALEVMKVGFGQFVADTAHNHSLLYGIVTAMMALLTGWFASVVFRRD